MDRSTAAHVPLSRLRVARVDEARRARMQTWGVASQRSSRTTNGAIADSLAGCKERGNFELHGRKQAKP